MKALELKRNVIIPRVTVAKKMEAPLHQPLSVLQSRVADQAAELRQSPADSRREQERRL